MSVNSFGAKSTLSVGDAAYEIFRLDAVEGADAAAVLSEDFVGESVAVLRMVRISPLMIFARWLGGMRGRSRLRRFSSLRLG